VCLFGEPLIKRNRSSFLMKISVLAMKSVCEFESACCSDGSMACVDCDSAGRLE